MSTCVFHTHILLRNDPNARVNKRRLALIARDRLAGRALAVGLDLFVERGDLGRKRGDVLR